MVRMFVRHSVQDYRVWRKACNAFGAARTAMGVTGAGVYRSADDPNEITAYHDFATITKASAFAGSACLKEVMKGAGVNSAPQIGFVKPA